MTSSEVTKFNRAIDAWCAELQGAPAYEVSGAKNAAGVGCGVLHVRQRKYKLSSPAGEVHLSVLGERVWLTFRGRQRQWTFRGLDAEAAMAEFFKRLRPFLEPVGELA